MAAAVGTRETADSVSRNQTELFSAGQTEHTKVTPVHGEHDLNSFPVCQMHQRSIGDLYSQVLILSENRCNPREIRLVQRSQLEGPAVETGQEPFDRQGVRPT